MLTFLLFYFQFHRLYIDLSLWTVVFVFLTHSAGLHSALLLSFTAPIVVCE